MSIWIILAISLGSAVVLGFIVGMIIGKIQLKKKRGDYTPLLSVKERVIYSACIVVGISSILFGIFVAPMIGSSSSDQIAYDEFGNPIVSDEFMMDENTEGEDTEGVSIKTSGNIRKGTIRRGNNVAVRVG